MATRNMMSALLRPTTAAMFMFTTRSRAGGVGALKRVVSSTHQLPLSSSLSSWKLGGSGVIRAFSTPSLVGIEDAQTLVEREHFAKVKHRLAADPRKKIPYVEYVDICSKEGLSKEQAKQLAQSLTDSGSILYFANSTNAVLRDFVFLKPVEFNKTVSRILAELSDDTYLREELSKKQDELVKLKAELQPIENRKAELEKQAGRRATVILWAGYGYCLIQAVIVARLTWWELSWDVMEPVTYMLTFATVMIGYSYFLLTRNEYTYEGLRKTLEKRKLAKLFRSKQFDETIHKKLREAVLLREAEVNQLLVDIKNDPVTLHLKDPSRPVV